jgi:site-specific DNA recombinase
MKKVALYARYSTDMQSENSIDDQFRQCRERAEKEGWKIVGEFHDRAISGTSMVRPGLQKLMQLARSRECDVVLTEALDRLARDQEDVAHIYKHLSFVDIELVTLSQGHINELHIGLTGTMDSLYIKELGKKTWRGLEGRAKAGKSTGGRRYGYETIRRER